jgi:hypothetical protein
MQVIDIKFVTRILNAQNWLFRVGGVGGSGFFGEETAKLDREKGCGWKDGMSQIAD